MQKTIELTEADYGGRLDAVLARHLDGNSRNYWSKVITGGQVRVNGKSPKTSYKVKLGDIVKIDLPDEKIEPIDLPIIFEDASVVVVDKPEGMLSHSKGAFNPEFTVADFMKGKYEGEQTQRSGIVHRLDRTTSGVMICAKNEEAMTFLQKQFSTRRVKKTYLALLSQMPSDKEAMIDVPIERNPKMPSTFRVGPNGKSAQTEFSVLKNEDGKVLVELRPTTGRTHQLRVHMAFLNLSIIGDTVYGGVPAKRVMLHANRLELDLPDGTHRFFESKPPTEFSL